MNDGIVLGWKKYLVEERRWMMGEKENGLDDGEHCVGKLFVYKW